MKTVTKTTAAAIGVLGMLLLGACSDPNAGTESTAAPTLTAQETSSPESSSEPASPTPQETEEPMDVPEVGDIVAAENIERARDLGASVYVSPTGDGGGVVIDPDAGTPEEVIRDVEALPSAMESDDAIVAEYELHTAAVDAGTGAFMLAEAPHFLGGEIVGHGYVVVLLGELDDPDEWRETVYPRSSRSAAIADAQPIMDQYPDWTFIDATD